jgi:thiol-disulfide isomerase/thioredoxin
MSRRHQRLSAILLLAACAKPSPAAAPDLPGASDLAALGYFSEEVAAAIPKKPCPGAADERALIGAAPPEWQLSDWQGSEPLSLAALRGRVVVVRFWTVGCPHCEATMPALQRLSEELRGEPVTFIGAFHAKPAGAARDMTEPAAVARGWGVTFPLALDGDWRTLRSWWLGGPHRHASSATFVIGKGGEVRHVHPGGSFYPSDDPSEARENRDYLAVREAILAAVAEP